MEHFQVEVRHFSYNKQECNFQSHGEIENTHEFEFVEEIT